MFVQTITAPKQLSSWLKWEVNPEFTREVGVLLAGSGSTRSVKAGELIAKNSGGKIVAWDPDAEDGTEDVIGIAVADAEAAASVDGSILYLARGAALIFAPELVWPSGVTSPNKAAATAALAALNVISRNG